MWKCIILETLYLEASLSDAVLCITSANRYHSCVISVDRGAFHPSVLLASFFQVLSYRVDVARIYVTPPYSDLEIDFKYLHSY